MLSVENNFYVILRVERTATTKEVKKAYRNLAKTLHPDVNKAVDAHERFDELEKAYSVLMNDEERERYDKYLAMEDLKQDQRVKAYDSTWLNMYRKESGVNKPMTPKPLSVNAFFTPEDVFRGNEKVLHIKRKCQCENCLGAKKVRVKPIQVCTVCNGKKAIRKTEKTWMGHLSHRLKCTHCEGTGFEIEDCSKCEGTGIGVKDATVTFEVPRNVTHRSTIVLKRQGHLGINGGANGELRVKMLLETKTSRYTIDLDGNIFENVYVDALDFYDGATEMAEMPSGKTVKLILPANASPGYSITIPGEGMKPSAHDPAGDLVFVFQATLPNLTEDVLRAISERVNKESELNG